MKKLIILGSTGSIGESVLAVVQSMRDDFEVVAVSCGSRAARLSAQVCGLGVKAACIVEEAGRGERLELPSGTKLYKGAAGLTAMIQETDAEMVVNGIAGSAGLLPSMAAISSGKDLALANKESLVMAGRILLDEASRLGRKVLPVDSEHAALFSILRGLDPSEVVELILTASGGALRGLPADALGTVTYADTLAHPTWKMGPKITVDSASMANKGLEVIEAYRLFGVPLSRIRVLMHPQSLVHSIVRTVDGTLHAEASTTDMRIPIQNALTFPRLRPSAVEWLDLAGKNLSFTPLDPSRSPMVGLAYRAAELSAAYPIVYNAVNEAAVEAFTRGRIPFMGIPRAVERALGLPWGPVPATIAQVLEIDGAARAGAKEFLK
jgi:1-deoxy-D-xylulose-5-phosphate reductoisomerase